MSKVTVELSGGLGNCLFQIATAYAYSKKYNKDLVLVPKIGGTVHNPFEYYSTTLFAKLKVDSKMDLSYFYPLKEQNFHYEELPYLGGNVLLQGHFQSEKYFVDYKQELRKLFDSPRREDLREIISHLIGTTAIHVRRGDYLNLKGKHPVLEMDYYRKAMELIPKGGNFLIFSDDIEWCKKNFSKDCFFIESEYDFDDLYLMTLCDNCIIANSTFSWWGAWLNANSFGKRIAPMEWFGDDYKDFNTQDLIPDSWIRITK